MGLIVLLVLTGCTRSKSTPTVAVGTQAGSVGGFSVPTAEGTQNMGIFDNLTTPTAMPDTGLAQPTATSEQITQPSAATATPQPVVVEPAQSQPTAVPAPTQVLPTAGPLPATYTLQKGEHPFCIARRYDLDQYELLSLNGLGTSTLLAPGTVLKIPNTGHHFISNRALKTHPATYKVAGGDTIYSIACGYGDVRPEVIAAANNLTAPYTLTAGMTLSIP